MENKYAIRLRNLLEELDIKQNELAKKAQVTEATISNYITGKQLPKLGVVEKISDILGVSVDYLLGKTDIKNYSNNEKINIDGLDTKDIKELQKQADYMKWKKQINTEFSNEKTI